MTFLASMTEPGVSATPQARRISSASAAESATPSTRMKPNGASNSAIAKFLEARGRSGIRRVVREPERWGRIVELAGRYGETLPPEPDSLALAHFLARRRQAGAHADIAALERVEQHVERHHFRQRRREPGLVGLVLEQHLIAARVHDDGRIAVVGEGRRCAGESNR